MVAIVHPVFRFPYAMAFAFCTGLLGVAITASCYLGIFHSLHYQTRGLGNINFAGFKAFMIILFCYLPILELIGLIAAFSPMKLFNQAERMNTLSKHVSSTMGQGIMVFLGAITVCWVALVFTFSIVVKGLKESFEYACAHVQNYDAPNQICLPLSLWGGRDQYCGSDYAGFCQTWTDNLRIDTMIAGTVLLLISGVTFGLATVTNYMRVRHNISDDLYEIEEHPAPAPAPIVPGAIPAQFIQSDTQYAQPMTQTYSQPMTQTYSQPMVQTTSQPIITQTYSQPMVQTYSQPIAQTYSQPMVQTTQSLSQSASQPGILQQSLSQPGLASQPSLQRIQSPLDLSSQSIPRANISRSNLSSQQIPQAYQAPSTPVQYYDDDDIPRAEF